ncbi:hypothetical protein D3C76_701510 [compost metagenome]
MFGQQSPIPIYSVHDPRYDHISGTPGNPASAPIERGRVRDKTRAFILRIAHIADPLGIESSHIKIVYRRLGGYMAIPRVSKPLAMRTIARHAAVQIGQL